MIINCDCGLQFLVKKSEIGSKGRYVQCGVCNNKWFHTSSNTKRETTTSMSNLEYSSPKIYKLTIFLVLILGFVGILDLLKNFFISLNSQFQFYYSSKEQIILKIIAFFK